MKHLSAAPHRLYFFLGALAVLTLFSWWWQQVSHQQLSSVPLHALVMPLGVFPLFILGFTFTAGPKWLGVDDQQSSFLVRGTSYFAGLLLLILSQILNLPQFQMTGFLLMTLVWLSATWRWATLIRLSKAKDKWHSIAICAAMAGGGLAMITCVFWTAGWENAWLYARDLSFFCFLLPVFVSVCHRMMPFFSSNVLAPYVMWRPYWLLAAWLSGCVLMAILDSSGWLLAEAAVALVMSFSFLFTSLKWGLIRSFSNRMLAMLHLSFAWLAIVFLLFAISGFGYISWSAPVHALALGFMGTMLVGFVSRVSFGHSGRPLVVSTPLWILYLSLHLAAAVRVTATLVNWPALLTWSAAAWLVLIACWVLMMAPIYLRARADGKPG